MAGGGPIRKQIKTDVRRVGCLGVLLGLALLLPRFGCPGPWTGEAPDEAGRSRPEAGEGGSPAPQPAAARSRVRGRVTAGAERLPSGTTVTLTLAASGKRLDEREVGPDGGFELDPGSERGAFHVVATAPGRVAEPASGTLPLPQDGATLEVRLRAPSAVSGVVQDARAQAIPGARVSIEGTAVLTDEVGLFLLKGIAPGRRTLRAELAGRAPATREIDVPEGGEVTHVVLTLR